MKDDSRPTKRNSKTSSCCERVGKPEWGEYVCTKCGAISCHLHAPIWTDEKFHCFFCFARTECLRKPISIPFEKNYNFSKSERKALIVIDGLYIAGVQRHCIELLNVLKYEHIACTILAIDGGGQWADHFVTLAEYVVIDIDNSLNWNTLREILQLDIDNFYFVSAHLTDAIEWTDKHVPLTIPRYAHFHSEPSEHELITRTWLKLYCKNYDSIFFPSNAVLQQFVKELGFRENGNNIINKFKILPNDIPKHLESISVNDKKSINKTEYLHLAIISRIDEDKFSIPLFINTVLQLNRLCLDFRIFIAGDGESMGKLKETIEYWGISKKINLLGFVHDVYKIYEWADVVFIPSKREGMPYVLLECMAFACPLVAPNIGLFQDIKPTGLILKYKQNDALEAALLIYKASFIKPDERINQRELLKSKYVNSKPWSNRVKEAYKLK